MFNKKKKILVTPETMKKLSDLQTKEKKFLMNYALIPKFLKQEVKELDFILRENPDGTVSRTDR